MTENTDAWVRIDEATGSVAVWTGAGFKVLIAGLNASQCQVTAGVLREALRAVDTVSRARAVADVEAG